MKTVKLSDEQWGILVELLVEQRNELRGALDEDNSEEDTDALSEQLEEVRSLLATVVLAGEA